MENKLIFDENALNDKDITNRKKIYDLYKQCPIPENEVMRNLGLFINRQSMSRIMFMNMLYQKIINTQGVIMEFGVRWGQNMALFESFRGMYEPFNFKRKIIGFDTFSGFETIDEKDGKSNVVKEKAYSVTDGYENYLKDILDYHEQESPIAHIQKYQLIKGDASITCKEYFNQNPQTIVAFAYFDLDVYKPTKDCLEIIKKHLVKGSVLGFDQLNDSVFPGETLALKEVFNLNELKIQRDPLNPDPSFIVIE
jgi:hypothetical protein